MPVKVNLKQIREAGDQLRLVQNDPVRFVRAVLGVNPDPWQIDALNALARGENVSIRSGHGVGKTALLAWCVLWFLSTRPYCRIPCTAPTGHQLSDLLWAEISLWLNRSPLKGLITWTATKVGLVGSEESWFAVARACTKPENLAGFHAPHLLYIVDEASGVPDKIMQAVDGALTTANAQIIMAGNPTRLSGYFYDSHHRARSQWHTLHVSSEDSPRVSNEYPTAMAAKWGKDTDIYRVRVKGDFPLGESEAFIRLDLVEAAILRWHDAKPDGACELGVDVARYGDDETVLALREGGYVHELECYRQWSTTQTTGRVVQIVKERFPAAVKVDDTGVGGAVTDGLVESCDSLGLHRTQIVPVNFGGAGDSEGHYDNAASVMWGRVRDMLIAGEIALPDDTDLAAQLTTRRWKTTSKGKIRLESKDDMKRRGLPSPDRADALVLAFAGGQALTSAGTAGGRHREARQMPG